MKSELGNEYRGYMGFETCYKCWWVLLATCRNKNYWSMPTVSAVIRSVKFLCSVSRLGSSEKPLQILLLSFFLFLVIAISENFPIYVTKGNVVPFDWLQVSLCFWGPFCARWAQWRPREFCMQTAYTTSSAHPCSFLTQLPWVELSIVLPRT